MAEKETSIIDSGSEQLTDEQKKKIEQLIEEEEGVTRKVTGAWSVIITVLAVAMSLFAIYTSIFPVTTQILRGVHVTFLLVLSFLYYPMAKLFKGKINIIDIFLALLSIACIAYMLIDFEDFIYRAVTPELWDKIFGIAFIVLVLEATRRSSGWIMPVTCLIFLAYAYFGPYLPAPWTHRGYDVERIIGHMYMTLEGIFGVPIDVSSTIIIMFCIFRRIPGGFRGRGLLRRVRFHCHGQETDRSRQGGGSHFVSPRNGLRFGCGKHRGHRIGGLPHASEIGVRQEQCRWISGGRRNGRNYHSARHGRRRFSYRRIS